MNGPLPIGSSLPARLGRAPEYRDVESELYTPGVPAEPDPLAALEVARGSDPATQQQVTLHFLSHVDAACFISLLQTMDPMPYDYRARAEYKRFYSQLHDSLEVPLPPQEPQPLDLPAE